MEQVEALRRQKYQQMLPSAPLGSKNVNSMSFIVNKTAETFTPSKETLKKFATEAENTANILEFNETKHVKGLWIV